MIAVWLLILCQLVLAEAESCNFQDVAFHFTVKDERHRAVVFDSTGESVALPGADGLAINLIQVSGDGSVCGRLGAYPVGPNKVAVLFEKLTSSVTNTWAVVLDVVQRKFEGEAIVLAPSLELHIKKTPRGFAFADFEAARGEVEAVVAGVGAASGLEMILQQKDLWRSVELGAKGLTTKLDRDLTWQNSRWKKYFASRPEFERAFRLSHNSDQIRLYFAFSREKKRDCIMLEHAGERKTHCVKVK